MKAVELPPVLVPRIIDHNLCKRLRYPTNHIQMPTKSALGHDSVSVRTFLAPLFAWLFILLAAFFLAAIHRHGYLSIGERKRDKGILRRRI